jgi:chemotaxis protein CheX
MLREEIVQIVDGVWQMTLGTPIRYVPSLQDAPMLGTPALTASIHFRGAWPGTLAATCSAALVQRMAARMFELPAGEGSAEDLMDAFGEIVNILGGNVKAVLPPPCELSLPALSEGDGASVDPRWRLVDTVHFDWEGEILLIRLWRDDAGGPTHAEREA